MKSLAAGCLLLLMSLPAFAEDLVITGLTPGRHYLRVDVAANGTATVNRIAVVDVSGTPPVTPPVDPPPTVPGGLAGVAKVAYDAAKQINKPDEARVLAGVYTETARQLETGEVDAPKAAANAAQAVDTLLGILNAKERWAPFRAAVTQYWTSQPPPNVPAVIADYKGLARGLEASAVGSAEDTDFVSQLAISLVAKQSEAAAISPDLIRQLLQAIRDRDFRSILAIIISLLLGGI